MFSDRIIWNETSKIAIENMRVSLFNFSSLLFLLSLFLIFMLLLMVMCCHGSVSPPPSTSLPARIINAFSDLFILCVWGGGWSAAGWDDSRACFSLWIYYLCSGPFKSTQSGPGASCGEFILTHRLLLPTQQPQLNPSKPAASTCLTPLMRCLWRFDLKVWRFCTCWPACSLLSFSSHILALLHNSMAFHP